MNADQNSAPSIWGRIMQWAASFEDALEMDASSYLEARLAYLEKRITTLEAGSSAREAKGS